MQRITINGTSISVVGSARNVSIVNGRVLVDGKDVTPSEVGPTIHIEIHGDVNQLDVDACETINITGSTGPISAQAGDIRCGDVQGSVSTQAGDIRCGDVQGSVSTVAGDIKHG